MSVFNKNSSLALWYLNVKIHFEQLLTTDTSAVITPEKEKSKKSTMGNLGSHTKLCQ